MITLKITVNESIHNEKLANEVSLDSKIVYLCSILKTQSIESLTINSEKLSDDNLKELGKLIKDNKTLNFLEVSNCELDDDKFSILAKALQENSTIKHLNLEGNSITDISALTNFLKGGVSYLNFNENQFTQNSLDILAKSLCHGNSLRHLHLFGVQCNDFSLLFQSIKKHPLITLDINFNFLQGDKNFNTLLSLLVENNSLLHVDIAFNFKAMERAQIISALKTKQLNFLNVNADIKTMSKEANFFDEISSLILKSKSLSSLILQGEAEVTDSKEYKAFESKLLKLYSALIVNTSITHLELPTFARDHQHDRLFSTESSFTGQYLFAERNQQLLKLYKMFDSLKDDDFKIYANRANSNISTQMDGCITAIEKINVLIKDAVNEFIESRRIIDDDAHLHYTIDKDLSDSIENSLKNADKKLTLLCDKFILYLISLENRDQKEDELLIKLCERYNNVKLINTACYAILKQAQLIDDTAGLTVESPEILSQINKTELFNRIEEKLQNENVAQSQQTLLSIVNFINSCPSISKPRSEPTQVNLGKKERSKSPSNKPHPKKFFSSQPSSSQSDPVANTSPHLP